MAKAYEPVKTDTPAENMNEREAYRRLEGSFGSEDKGNDTVPVAVPKPK